jgi:hypothetical protein
MSGSYVISESGLSTVEVEEPDLIIYRLRGKLEPLDLHTFREADGTWNEGKRSLLVLIDNREQAPADHRTRKISLQPPIGTRNRAIAVFGGNRHVRILADLSMRALSVLTNRQVHTRLFEDETSAREWLYAQRSFLVSRQDKF